MTSDLLIDHNSKNMNKNEEMDIEGGWFLFTSEKNEMFTRHLANFSKTLN